MKNKKLLIEEQEKLLKKTLNQATKRFNPPEPTKHELYNRIMYLSEQKKYSAFTLVMTFVAGYFICLLSILFAQALIEGI